MSGGRGAGPNIREMLTAALDGPADWDALEQRWDREADLGDVAAFIEANVDDFFVDDSSA